jgi:hypothetical protein
MARRSLPSLDAESADHAAALGDATALAERGIEAPSADASIVGIRQREMRATQQAKAFHRARRAGEVDETPTRIVVLTDLRPWAIVELPEDECFVDDAGVAHRFKRVGETGFTWVGEGDHREKEPTFGPVDNERPLSHGEHAIVPRWCAEKLVATRHATIVS